ncbi:hypothetical protein JI739_07375 [Ramlibacter sp. AW1]|uniref:Uncharacterized protein n=1 Tax=Ramlibacter aurantiacus TaxID=2801330 RepID=A0A936ZS90_9BURK|nr:hypothetical protein [Ramlibacter aurantiacus]MBL0420165.1 hypothetical protein [Ramlibacter aurantiacus]
MGFEKAGRVPREWAKRDWFCPREILIGYRRIALELPLDQMSYPVASLRTNKLKRYREGRQAALFCYGISQRLGTPVHFALIEDSSFDVVAHYNKDGASHFVKIQLKEWVPRFLPRAQTLQNELGKLSKYTESDDLVVAVHLNRDEIVRINELQMPENIGELWFFGARTLDQLEWTLIGNCLAGGSASDFTYPTESDATQGGTATA